MGEIIENINLLMDKIC